MPLSPESQQLCLGDVCSYRHLRQDIATGGIRHRMRGDSGTGRRDVYAGERPAAGVGHAPDNRPGRRLLTGGRGTHAQH